MGALGVVLVVVVFVVVLLLVAVVATLALRRPKAARGGARDPYTLSEPWRRFVMSAQGAQRRYRGALKAPPGPLRDRLVEIGARIDAGVDEIWWIAVRGDALDDAISAIGAGAAARRRDALPRSGDADLTETEQALAAQEESAARLVQTAADAKATLRLLDARLDEAVARGLELALTAGDTSLASGLDSEVATLVDEMEALRLALDEVGPGRGTATA